MQQEGRGKNGRFEKGNKIGPRFGNTAAGRSGDAAVINAIEAGIKGNESQKRMRLESEAYEILSNLSIPVDFVEIHKAMEQFGIEPSQRDFQMGEAVNMYRIALGNDKKQAISAAAHIHRCRTDGKVDMKVTMEQAKPKPAIVIDDFEGEEGE